MNWPGMTRSSGWTSSFMLPTAETETTHSTHRRAGAGHAHPRDAPHQRVRPVEDDLDVITGEADEAARRAVARLQHEHVVRPPHQRAPEGGALGGAQRAQARGAARDRRALHAAGPARRLRPPAL